MSEVKIKQIMGDIKMPSVKTVQTSIKVPEDKYEALKELKSIEETTISNLVLEGIDLLLKNRAPVLEDSLGRKADIISKVLKDLKE